MLLLWLSLLLDIGSEERAWEWEEEWMSNVSDAVVVVGVVRRRDSRGEACLNLVNNGTPRSVALKGGKGWRVRNGVCVCVSECSLLSCERLYSVVPLRVSLFVPCAGKKI